MDVKGENRRGLTIGGEDYISNQPAWSPDGSVVIFSRSVFSDTTGSTKLMAIPYTETGALPVDVPNSQLEADASYSFDGYWLLFTSWYSGFHDIYIMRVNGVDRTPIEDDPAYDFDPAWRPNPLNQP
jgi:Tol biopolymer transport system component